MKKFTLCFLSLCLFITTISYSQTPVFWGCAEWGGPTNNGAIFKINGDGSGYIVAHYFDSADGSFPSGTLLLAANKKLYGTTCYEGKHDKGTIFCIDPLTNKFTDLYSFESLTKYAYPGTSFVTINDTIIYGVRRSKENNSKGILFSYNVYNNVFKVEYYFSSATCGNPQEIIVARDKKIYGTTDTGGVYGRGALFSYDPSTKKYSDLHDFDTAENHAIGHLAQTANGKLYGMAEGRNCIIFSWDIKNTTYRKEFISANKNFAPSWNNSLTEVNGKLYGMTFYNGNYGYLFSFDPSTSKLSNLMDFDDIHGQKPKWGFTLASDGKLYGGTSHGGEHMQGNLFVFNPADNSYKDIFDFNHTIGGNPSCNLTEVDTMTK